MTFDPNPTLVISIDRTSLGLDPLVMAASGDTPLTVVAYTEPAEVQNIDWVPDSRHVAGSVPKSAVLQHSLLPFSVTTRDAVSEAASRGLIAELRAAVSRLRYPVTVTISGAPAETWSCNAANVTPAGERTFVDLANKNPVWAVSAPCHPVRTVS